MNLFNLSLRLNGFPIKAANLTLQKIQNLDEASYANYFNEQRAAILNHHLEHNSFYKKLAPNAHIKNWADIPVITKLDLQCPVEDRLSKGYTAKNCHIHKTSGSSGTPFIFAKDKYCHAITWSGFIKKYSWYNLNFNTSKQARFYGIPLNTIGYYKERLKDFLSKRYRFSVFDLSDQQLEKNLNKFKTTSFDYINGYTSSIVQFAKFLERKNIILKTVCPSLNVCIVTSEMLFESDKTLIEKQFGIPVVNEYGAAELGLIAFQNKNDEWLVNSDDLYIEILDKNNKPLPYGKEGKIVITSLFNKAHPFIRYELGDIGSLCESSTLRKPILKTLMGRTSDIAILPSGKRAAGLTFYYVTKSIIDNDANVKEFVIEQQKLDTFKISYVSINKLTTTEKETINKAICKYLEPGLKIDFEHKTELKRAKSGKLKQFTSCLKQ